jgi:hypothetical protein
MTPEHHELDRLLNYVAENADAILHARRYLDIPIADGICRAVRRAAKIEKLRKESAHEPQPEKP